MLAGFLYLHRTVSAHEALNRIYIQYVKLKVDIEPDASSVFVKNVFIEGLRGELNEHKTIFVPCLKNAAHWIFTRYEAAILVQFLESWQRINYEFTPPLQACIIYRGLYCTIFE